MTKVQKIEQPEHTPEELAKLVEKQRKQQEDIDWLNAQAPRPAELGGDWIAAGIVKAMAKHGPRKEADEKP